MMDVLEKLPGMADDELANLCANAERLEKAGSPAQRASAAKLLPTIKAELAARRDVKLERAAEKRREASELRAGKKKASKAAEAGADAAPA